jgi:hypothetical protein
MDLTYRVGLRFGMRHSKRNLWGNALCLDTFNGMMTAVQF